MPLVDKTRRDDGILRVDAIKLSTDLLSLVESDLGPPEYRRQAYAQWYCPLHADVDTPSLTVYTEAGKGWFCFGCSKGGSAIDWIIEYYQKSFGEAMEILSGEVEPLSLAELEAMAAEREKLAAENRRRARLKREKAAKLLAEAAELEEWADELLNDAKALRFLADKGISEAIAAHFHLGLNREFYLGPAISIPWSVSGELRNVQYRVISGSNSNRYRWDQRGTRATVFNADMVAGEGDLLIVEGAIKCMVMTQHGFDCCAITNRGGWQRGWAKKFRHRPVYVALDPDAEQEAQTIAQNVGNTARVVQMPAKPDDLITQYGWSADDIQWLLSQGEVGHD